MKLLGRMLVAIVALAATAAAQAGDPWPQRDALSSWTEKLLVEEKAGHAEAVATFSRALSATRDENPLRRAGAFRLLADVLEETYDEQHLPGFQAYPKLCERGALDMDVRVRAHAFRAIAALGHHGQDLALFLAKTFQRPDNAAIRGVIARAAGSIRPNDPVVLPCLEWGLARGQIEVRRAAAFGLSCLREKAAPATNGLAACLDGDDRKLLEVTLEALRRIGPAAGAAVPKLRVQLAKRPARLKLRIIHALGSIGPAARDALPDLAAHVDEEPEDVLQAALAIAPKDPVTVELARKALGPFRDRVSPDQIDDLYLIGEAGKTLVPHAYAALRWSPLALARALLSWGESPSDIINALGKFITDPDAGWHAVGAMAIIDEKGLLAAPHLLRRIANLPRLGLRYRSVLALGHYGRKVADRSVPALTRVLRHALATDDSELERDSLLALAAIGVSARAALPAVFEARQKHEDDPKQFSHVRISWAMARLAPDSPQVQRDLVRALNVEDDQLRYHLFEPITTLRTLHREIVLPELLKTLESDRRGWSAWMWAARVVGHHRIRTPRAVAALRRHLAAGWPEGVNEVIHALDRVLPAIPESTPHLVSSLEEPTSTDEVLYAIYALGRKADDGDTKALQALDALREKGAAETKPIGALLTGVRTRLKPLVVDPSVLARAQARLNVEVDPNLDSQGCWWEHEFLDPRPRPTPRLDRLPDGSYRVALTTGPGLEGAGLSLFVSRTRGGRPEVHGRMGMWTCVMLGDPTYRIEGTITLASTDWDTVPRIRGRFDITVTNSYDDGEKVTTREFGGFDVPNPFLR